MAKGKGKKTFPMKNVIFSLLGIILIAFIGLLAYSAYIFQSSPQEEEGFYVCNEENTECKLSQHIHADIDVLVCGEEYVFPRETGLTTEMHTHKERNYMHWHSPVSVDPSTREPLSIEKDRLTVGAFLKQLKFTFPETCPENSNPEMTFKVNGSENSEGLEYMWVDGDDVFIEYK